MAAEMQHAQALVQLEGRELAAGHLALAKVLEQSLKRCRPRRRRPGPGPAHQQRCAQDLSSRARHNAEAPRPRAPVSESLTI